MNRTTLNLLIDLTAAILLLGMVATGYILWFALPPGTQKDLMLWGMARHSWGNIHAWISFALLGAFLIHICLHWQWLVSVIGKRLNLLNAAPGNHWKSGLATAALTAAALGSFVWVVQTGIRPITNTEELGVCPAGIGKENKTSQTQDSFTALSNPKINFWKEVYPLLEKSCLTCHGPNRARGGFRVDRREDFVGSAGKEALVMPGNSGASPLITIISGQSKNVPRPEVHRLSEADVALVRAWIDAGAEWPERPSQE
jgi:hypothetical protein